MSQGARVSDIEAIKTFRAALIKFAQIGNVALAAGESDIERMAAWLEREQTVYWANQLRKRHEEVIRCEDAVRQKRIFKAPDGSTQSVVDEMKALQRAQKSREEAEQKTIAVKKAIQVLAKESMAYKGRIQGLATVLQADVPSAVHQLDLMLDHLDAYLAIETMGTGIPETESSPILVGEITRVPVVGYQGLRGQTPTPEERSAAPFTTVSAAHSLFHLSTVGVSDHWQQQTLSGLAIERTEVDLEQRVIFDPDASQQSRIYLERMAPAFDGDTGWFLGPMAASREKDQQFHAMRAGDLIAAKPNIGQLLSFPTGFLIVLDGAGVVAILDPTGIDVWAIALSSSRAAGSE